MSMQLIWDFRTGRTKYVAQLSAAHRFIRCMWRFLLDSNIQASFKGQTFDLFNAVARCAPAVISPIPLSLLARERLRWGSKQRWK